MHVYVCVQERFAALSHALDDGRGIKTKFKALTTISIKNKILTEVYVKPPRFPFVI